MSDNSRGYGLEKLVEEMEKRMGKHGVQRNKTVRVGILRKRTYRFDIVYGLPGMETYGECKYHENGNVPVSEVVEFKRKFQSLFNPLGLRRAVMYTNSDFSKEAKKAADGVRLVDGKRLAKLFKRSHGFYGLFRDYDLEQEIRRYAQK